MMLGPRLGILALLLMAGCATVGPPSAEPQSPPPEAAPAAAVGEPALVLAHRRHWQRIPLPRGTRLAEAFLASEILAHPDGTRRVWIVINLLGPIRLPETGGYARSAAYLADFRCGPHAWNPLLGIWYSQRNAVGEALREPARGPSGIRDVGEGSFVDLFVNAACAGPPRSSRVSRQSRG